MSPNILAKLLLKAMCMPWICPWTGWQGDLVIRKPVLQVEAQDQPLQQQASICLFKCPWAQWRHWIPGGERRFVLFLAVFKEEALYLDGVMMNQLGKTADNCGECVLQRHYVLSRKANPVYIMKTNVRCFSTYTWLSLLFKIQFRSKYEKLSSLLMLQHQLHFFT